MCERPAVLEVEVTHSRAACRVYDILASDGRQVAVAILFDRLG